MADDESHFAKGSGPAAEQRCSSLQELCIEQIATDIGSYCSVPLPAEWHDKLWRILAASGRLTPNSLMPLLRSKDWGDALESELGCRSSLALGSVGFRALAAANLSYKHMRSAGAGLCLHPAGTLRGPGDVAHRRAVVVTQYI